MSEPIDLDELEYPARVSRDSGFKSVNLSIDVAMAMIEELRQSRARVAELEAKQLPTCELCGGRGGDGGQAQDGTWEFPCESCYGIGRVDRELGAARVRHASAEARVKELESRLASLACPMPGCDGDIGCVLHGAMARVKELEAENVRLRESLADAWAEGCAWISIFSADGGK